MLTTIATLILGQSGFAPLPPTHQLLTGDILAWARSTPNRYAAIWPPSNAATAEHDRVPDNVWEEHSTWITRMIKPEWLPADLRARTIAFRQYHEEDTLAVRYRKDGWDVQILERYGIVCLTVKEVNGSVLTLPAPASVTESFVKQTMARFLKMSPAESADAMVEGSYVPVEADTCFTFSIRSLAGYQFVSPWWMAQGFTDGKAVFFNMLKSVDEQQTGGAQRASSENLGIRFLPDRN